MTTAVEMSVLRETKEQLERLLQLHNEVFDELEGLLAFASLRLQQRVPEELQLAAQICKQMASMRA